MEAIRQAQTIAKREWSSYFNSPIAYVFIIIFLVLSAFFTFNIAGFYENGQADLSAFFVWHPWLYLVLVPAAAMRLWSEERRSRTIELLFTLSVTPWQAILGKFAAAWLFLLLALALTFPLPLTAGYLGEPDAGVMFCGYLGSGLLAGAYLAVGMFTSALTRNQVIAFILAVVLGLFLILAGYPPVTEVLVQWLPFPLVNVIAGFSFMSHFDALQRGVLDLRNLAYFASVIGFMLFATHAVLHHKAATT